MSKNAGYRENAKPSEAPSFRVTVHVHLPATVVRDAIRNHLLSLGWDPRKTPADLKIEVFSTGNVFVSYELENRAP